MRQKRLAALVLAAAMAGGCSAAPPAAGEGQLPETAVQGQQTLFFQQGNTIAQMVSRLSPSVVGLAVSVGSGEDRVEGLGTGFFVDESGYILTNHHVAGEADGITVVMADGTKHRAHKVWSDKVLDLAVVRCDGGGPFVPVTLGSVAQLQVGDPVAAIGTPLDMSFQHTVTAGIVSGLNRTLQVPTSFGLSFLEELVQTDASINPGNSGGPLLTMDGKVIGINTVKVTEAEGMGFAIPVDLAQPIVEKILRDGEFTAPYVGVTVIDRDISRFYGQQVERGLAVLNVDPEGPAHRAGLEPGDVILSVGGEQPQSVLAFRRRVYAASVGEALPIQWKRGAQKLEGEVILTEKPQR